MIKLLKYLSFAILKKVLITFVVIIENGKREIMKEF